MLAWWFWWSWWWFWWSWGWFFLAPVAAVALPLLLPVLKPSSGPPKPPPEPPKTTQNEKQKEKHNEKHCLALPLPVFLLFFIKFDDSRHAELSIYTVFHEESESEVKNAKFQAPEKKNMEKTKLKKIRDSYICFLISFFGSSV